MNQYDISIIGGGHAGAEAAHIAARLGRSVALISIPGVEIASAPCNPAIGGVGKGQVVREIDALGGMMGEVSDLAGIQFRTLNDSKGFAVRSTRIQIDKNLYPKIIRERLDSLKNLTIISDQVVLVSKIDDGFTLTLRSGTKLLSKKIIVTTGTFLGGLLHCGANVTEGGRVSVAASASLATIFENLNLKSFRFKTGTPPRLYTESIDFSQMHIQESDASTVNFHSLHPREQRFIPQKACYLTRTKPETLEIIRQARELSPIFNGQIKGVGPRYCPSIEDKAFRYPDRNGHHIFIEPESSDGLTVYPNGISTSLPPLIQERFIRTIPGLERAMFAVHGYAVEYDAIDTTQLSRTLMHKEIDGLYFAGQVNGTSGYEEAAGQGIIAGINAALSFSGKKLILDREFSYIGVMIEDLVLNERDEPYRLFTARAENRLSIREDNTLLRMRKYREVLGLNDELDRFQKRAIFEYNSLKSFVFDDFRSNESLKEVILQNKHDPVGAYRRVLTGSGISATDLVTEMVAVELYYEGYVSLASEQTQRLSKLKSKRVDWSEIAAENNVSFECRQRIRSAKPETFGDLMSITGLRPATLAYVAGRIS